MKQLGFFKDLYPSKLGGKYTSKIQIPIYEPKNKKPRVLELFNPSKTNKLINEIEKSNVFSREKMFLIEAAKRHTIFNYESIADYYAHSNLEMQDLMEKSALVIIDFDKAIEYGYVTLCNEIRKQYLEEYEE